MKRIQELLRNASLAERVITFISVILLLSIGIVWFVGVHLNSTNQTQTIVPTTIQENVKVAEEAVAMLESSNTEDNLQHAKDAINQLSGGTVKEELQKRVDVVDKAMKKKAEEIKKAKLKAELVRAEAAKKLAEEQKNSETSDSSTVTTLDETTTGGTESLCTGHFFNPPILSWANTAATRHSTCASSRPKLRMPKATSS